MTAEFNTNEQRLFNTLATLHLLCASISQMSALSVLALACAVVGARGVRLQTSRVAPLVDARGAPPTRVAGALAPLVDAGAPPTQRPSLLPYNPLPAPGAVVVDSTGTARFTVLTPRLIRMEQASAPGAFEDRATIAFLNRNLPVPSFTHGEAGGVLTITTASVVLSYTVGQPFSRTTLTVASADPTSAFTSWRFGAAFPGNLLGTIRGLDEQSETSLNCTLNAGIDDNGEFNHCEWGLISRDGWAVVDDTPNYCLDANDWWSTTGSRKCGATFAGTDATDPTNSNAFPLGTTVASQADCCAACMSDPSCGAGYVWDTNAGQSPNCWPLAGMNGKTPSSQGRTLGLATNPTSNTDAVDLYGFFHGHDYYGAIADFVAVSGKTAMVPKYAAGVWWSRWYDLSNYDTTKIVDDYESRQIPLDVFVIDMDWHVSAPSSCASPRVPRPPPRLAPALPHVTPPSPPFPPPPTSEKGRLVRFYVRQPLVPLPLGLHGVPQAQGARDHAQHPRRVGRELVGGALPRAELVPRAARQLDQGALQPRQRDGGVRRRGHCAGRPRVQQVDRCASSRFEGRTRLQSLSPTLLHRDGLALTALLAPLPSSLLCADFWWIDWQQGNYNGGVAGASPRSSPSPLCSPH